MKIYQLICKELTLATMLALVSTISMAEELKVIDWPKYPNSSTYFDFESPVHGICKAMGYSYGIQGSKHFSRVYGKRDVIQVRRNGIINLSENDFPVSKVICVNKTSVRPRQRIAVLDWPKHPKSDVYFDFESSYHGICRAMGYSYGVKGSTRYSRAYGKLDIVQVRRDGTINLAENDYPVSKIICVNRTYTRPSEKISVLDWPEHPKSGVYFDFESSNHGICRAMGYSYGVKGSRRYSSAYGKLDVVQVRINGTINLAENDYPVSKILCVNKTSTRPAQTISVLDWPKHPESNAYFDFESSIHGICKIKGYAYGVQGSTRFSRAYGKLNVIQVNENGKVRLVENDYPASKIICVNKGN